MPTCRGLEMKRLGIALKDLLIQNIESPMVGAEIGVWRGDSSSTLLRYIKELTLHMIDPWETGGGHTTMPKIIEELKAAKIEAAERTLMYTDRRIIHVQTSEEAAPLFENKSLDFVFIDAEHTYECVKQDINLWYPKVKLGGILSGHDYNGVGDRRGRFGVKKAVDEWASINGLEIQEESSRIWYTKV